jgi:hypothetical protein
MKNTTRLAAICALLFLSTAQAAPIDDAEQALQARQFEAAIDHLEKSKPGDYASYLKAVALFQSGKHIAAVVTCERLLKKYPDSQWLHKARFLMARALIAQKDHKAAEVILAEEAGRIFSPDRKQSIANVLVDFADKLARRPDPNELDALPPDDGKALALYQQVLALEVRRKLRDDIQFKVALTFQRLRQHPQAIAVLRQYVGEFDPTWTGPVGSATRQRGQLKQNPVAPGKHRLKARFALINSQIINGNNDAARQNVDAFLPVLQDTVMEFDDGRGGTVKRDKSDVAHQRVLTYAKDLPNSIAETRKFLAAYPDYNLAIELARGLPNTLAGLGRTDEAIAAHRDFVEGKNFKFVADEKATTPDPKTGVSPAENLEKLQRESFFQIAQLLFNQKKYDEAIKQWQAYVNRYPDGAQWAASQSGIINAEFQIGLDAVAAGEDAKARQHFAQFLNKYPLDNRARQIMFTLGQMYVANGEYKKAIEEWSRLISKYPNTEESSLALYRTGVFQSEQLGQIEEALATFRRLTWGSWARLAKARVVMLSQKSLGVATERTYRTDEVAKIAVTARNIEKLKVSFFPLNLESYFRKTHKLARIDHLDIDLIEPQKAWEVKLDGYKKYAQLIRDIEIPFPGKRPGIAVVKVEGGDWSASTLVVRSDIDLILKSSRKEALVYVENRLKNKPAADTQLLFSDGTSIIAIGTTGPDGVFRGRFPELTTIKDLRVLATGPSGSATNLLNIGNLRFSTGLSRRGYIYTDKSAYQQGEAVAVRGIIRDVESGSYIVPEKREYTVRITDPAGRLLGESELTLSEFGTFDTAIRLPTSAAFGNYSIIAHPKGKKEITYQGNFAVQQFKLDRVRLAFDFPQQVYFRGEKIETTLSAIYYWGSPAADKLVEISLPDGRKLSQKTDAEGKIAISLDTAGFVPGTPLQFGASIPSLNISANNAVYLAKLGYGIALKPDQPLALANEAFEVQVNTIGADGKPVGKDLTITVLRSEVQKQNAVLEAVPWIAYNPKPTAQVTVEEIQVSTDPKTGKGTAILNLKKGGVHVLRATGQDRFDQTVTGQTMVRVSDDEDLQKLRFFAEKSTYEVGAKIPLRLHSRVAKGLALLTYEGEEVISHKIISIKRGDNKLEIPVEHAHFPNFRVSVALIDGRVLRGASKRFNIKRELKVTITPSKETYAPGEIATVDIAVTDQLGKPVKAELALALVNQALLDRFPDGTAKVLTFFQKGASRFTEFSLISTCDWSYTAFSKRTRAGGNEATIVANDSEQILSINQLELNLNPRNSILTFACASAHESIFNNGRFQQLTPPLHQRGQAGQTFSNFNLHDSFQIDESEVGRIVETESSVPLLGDSVLGRLFNGQSTMTVSGGVRLGLELKRDASHTGIAGATTVWLSPITTGEDGKAQSKVQLPDSAGQWNLAAKGCTTDTLVGQASTKVITRKDFLVELRTRDVLQEGDTMELLATIHNLTDFEGDATVTLKISGAAQPFSPKKTIRIEKQSTTEVVFDGYTIPFTESLKLEVSATAGDHSDSSDTNLRIRPWGLEYAAHTGGVTSTEAGAKLTLPKKQKYSSRKLHVTVSPSIEQAIIDLALERGRPLFGASCIYPPEPQTPASALLAATSALNYARDRGASSREIANLAERVRSLVSGVVVTQLKDGSWPWNNLAGHSTRTSTATIYWGLALAKEAGIPVQQSTFENAEKYFTRTFSKIDSNDAESKALVIHALSLTGRADFSAANRLYRERQSLSETALAYMAAAFVRMSRPGFAEDLLKILDTKLVEKCRWKSNSQHSILSDDIGTTAIALWSYARLRRDSATTAAVANHLLAQTTRLPSNRSLGTVVAALAEYYNHGERPGDDFTIELLINDQLAGTIKSADLKTTQTFALPLERIDAGENTIRIKVDGLGQVRYTATLFGFSPDLRDPETLDYPYIDRKVYYHDKLAYREVPLKAYSSSPVTSLELGQRFRTHVSFHNNTSDGRQSEYLVYEEHIPTGTLLVSGSLAGNYKRVETEGSKIRFYFAPGRLNQINYELVAHAPGKYRVLPGIVRDVVDRGRMRVGKSSDLEILKPGEKSADPYKTNGAEHFELATKLFNDGKMDDAQAHLDALFADKDDRKKHERDVARMLLWIHTTTNPTRKRGTLDAPRIVQMFEILRERHPELVIPFDKTLTVGRAYRGISEFERAWLVFQAAIESSFLNDAKLSAVLEDQGQYLGSVRYQEQLWFEYPDSADVTTAFFALSQSLFQKAPEAKAIAAREKRLRQRLPTLDEADAEIHEKPGDRDEPEKIAMLQHSRDLLHRFLTLYATDPLADDAAFSAANVYFALKDYANVVTHAARGAERHADSELKTSFEYMAALGHFWQRHYKEALASATSVASGGSKDCDYARYITAQIYHATGKPADAMTWYEKVRELYPDAADAIDYFKEKKISMGEVTTLQPGEVVEIKIDYRNIKEAALEIYKVDLMKLYLREKNLSNITAVDLAGIDPESSLSIPLGDGKDFADKTKKAKLPIKEEGAYLVICRGDNLYTSGLILITPLKLEIQETPAEGSVRVNVRDLTAGGNYIPEVLVKVVGTHNDLFLSGHTDLRGVFQADGVNGTATVLARAESGKYAFYRGQQTHGTAPKPNAAAKPPMERKPANGKKQLQQSDYLRNIEERNKAVQDSNFKAWDMQRRGDNRGVEVRKAE